MRILYFVLFFLVLTAFSFSQQWCAPGSVWNYKVDDNSYPNARLGYTELKVTGSATLHGKTCNVITGEYNGIGFVYWDPDVPQWTETSSFKFYSYEDSGVIYISDGGRFDTIVDFNALPGDKWLKTFGDTSCLGGWNPITVQDTGHLTINGKFLKTIQAGYNLFIEGIGGVSWFMYVEQSCQMHQKGYGQFTCFKNDNFPVYMSSKHNECANMVALEEKIPPAAVKVFPNPGDGKFNIFLPQAAKARIINADGRCVYSDFLQEGINVIHFESERPGFYFLELSNGVNRHSMKLFNKTD